MLNFLSLVVRNLCTLTAAIGLLLGIAETAQAQSDYPTSPQAAPAQVDSIVWLSNPEQAVADARQAGRPILVYITSDNCGYCRKMERESWSHPTIKQNVAGGYVPLRLNAKQHVAIVKALKVRAFPTTLLLTTDGNVANASAGYLSPTKLAKLLATGSEVAALAQAKSTVGTH